jgi:hypothetical protein
MRHPFSKKRKHIMKPRHLIILFALMNTAFSCHPVETDNGIKKKNKLVGTWKLIEYSDFDSVSNTWKHPYGDHPKGYFTYTNSGIVNLNGSAEKPLVIPPDSEYVKPVTLGAILDNAWGYFGTYTIDTLNSIVTHHVKGGSVINYIGTDQHRQFIIKGDTLLLGDPRFEVGKRVLIREE